MITLPAWFALLILLGAFFLGVWTSYMVFGTIQGSSKG